MQKVGQKKTSSKIKFNVIIKELNNYDKGGNGYVAIYSRIYRHNVTYHPW